MILDRAYKDRTEKYNDLEMIVQGMSEIDWLQFQIIISNNDYKTMIVRTSGSWLVRKTGPEQS